jgi:hypothetical protein
MSKTIFEKDYDDKYDGKTTLSADLNKILDGLPQESRAGIAKDIVANEYGHSKIKTIGGFITIIVGAFFMLLGVRGVINLDIAVGKITAKLINASPGVFVALIGLIIVLRSGSKPK